MTYVTDTLNSYLASYHLINNQSELAVPLLNEMKLNYMDVDYIFYNYILEILIKIYTNNNNKQWLIIHQLLLLQSYFKYYIHFVDKIPVLLNQFYPNTKLEMIDKKYNCFINNLITLPTESIYCYCYYYYFLI